MLQIDPDRSFRRYACDQISAVGNVEMRAVLRVRLSVFVIPDIRFGKAGQIAYHRTGADRRGPYGAFKPPRKVSFAKLPGQSFNLFCFEKKYGHSPKSRTLVILIRVRRFLMAAEI